MKKTILLSLILLSITTVIAQPVVTPTGFLMARDMQPDFAGYNGTNTITQGQTWKDIASHLGDLVTLQPDVLRYPGGTVANYWNWQDGKFLEEYQMTVGISGIKLPQKFVNFNTGLADKKEDVLKEFKKSSDITGGAPIFNFNMFTSDYPYQLAMAYHVKEIGLPFKYLEFGNEFYNDFEEHRLVFPSVADYANKCKAWALNLKSASWGSTPPKIGIVGAWGLPIAEGRQRMWLKNLMTQIATDTNINAVTIHQYLGTGFARYLIDSLADSLCLSEVIGGTNGKKEYAHIAIRQAFENIDSLKHNEFPMIYTYGKEIWITEFNIGDHKFVTFGSWLQAMMVSTMLLTYLEDPHVAKVLMHDLVGNAAASAMFNGDTTNLDYEVGASNPVAGGCNGAGSANYKTQPWQRSATGNAVALIASGIKESTYAQQINFTGLGLPYIDTVNNKYPILYGWKFTKPYGTEYIILNNGYAASKVKLNTIAAGLSGKFQRIQAGVDDYILGNDTLNAAPHRPKLDTATFNAGDTLLMPPYSIVRVVFRNSPVAVHLVATEDTLCVGTSTTVTAYNYDGLADSLYWSVNGSAFAHSTYKDVLTVNASDTITDTVVVKDINNNRDTIYIKVFTPPTLNTAVVIDTVCNPADTVRLIANCTGGTGGPYNYVWAPSYGVVSTGTYPAINDTVIVSPGRTTVYKVYATDGRCWVSNDLNPDTIKSKKPILTLTDNVIKCLESPLRPVPLEVTSSIGGSTYLWSTGSTLSTVTVIPDTVTTYTVTVTNNGCSDSAKVKVNTIENCCLTGNAKDVIVYDSIGFMATVDTLVKRIDDVTGTKAYVHTAGVVTDTCKTSLAYLYINGYFRVDKNLTFDSCFIKFGEKAEVHLDPGVTLKLLGCSLTACSDWTWRSIFVFDETSSIIIEDKTGNGTVHCYIDDADTAVSLAHNARYDISHCRFGNNYTSMYLYNYMATGEERSNMVFGNRFSSGALKKPYSNYGKLYGISGISIYHSENIVIGKSSSGANAANTFIDLHCGINGRNANFEAVNNDFSFMHLHDDLPETTGMGIATLSAFDYNDRTVMIGDGTANGCNNFDTSVTGVYLDGQQNAMIDSNNFGLNNRLTNVSLYIEGNDNKTVEVRNNKFKDYMIGTYLYKNGGNTYIDIDSNLYTNAWTADIETQFYGTAITVQNPSMSYSYDDKPRLFIFHNTITNPRIGIHTSQLYKPCIGDYDREDGHGLQPGTDTIRFDLGSVSDYTEGILVQGCSYSKVVNNIIKNIQQAFDENSGGNLFRGMEFNLCDHSFINCNKIDSISRSIYFEGDCNFSRMRLNVMTDFEYGVEIADNSVNLPEQGDVYASDTVPYDNEWVEGIVSVNRVHNSEQVSGPNFFNWYYNGSNTTLYRPAPSNTVFDIPVSLDCNCDCSSFDEGGEEEARSMSMGKIINNEVSYSDYSNEKAYQSKMSVFKNLKKNNYLISLGKPDDYVYEDFYSDMNNGNMGLFDSINVVLLNDSNGIESAIVLNNAVDDTNYVEYYLKTVNDILLNKVVQNIELTANDTSILEFICILPLAIAGTAKYKAAALLKKEVHEHHQSGSRHTANQNLSSVNASVILYPNPADDKVTLILSGIHDYTKASIRLFDSANKVAGCTKIKSAVTVLNINMLSQGIYIYSVISGGKVIAGGKFTVVR